MQSRLCAHEIVIASAECESRHNSSPGQGASDPAGTDRGGVLSRWLGQTVSDGRPAKQQLDLGHHSQDDGLVAERVPDRPEGRRIVGLTVIPTLPAPLEVISGRSPDAHRHHVREHRAGGDAGSDVVETVPSGSLSLRL
jgi:hypothetical protein